MCNIKTVEDMYQYIEIPSACLQQTLHVAKVIVPVVNKDRKQMFIHSIMGCITFVHLLTQCTYKYLSEKSAP